MNFNYQPLAASIQKHLPDTLVGTQRFIANASMQYRVSDRETGRVLYEGCDSDALLIKVRAYKKRAAVLTKAVAFRDQLRADIAKHEAEMAQ